MGVNYATVQAKNDSTGFSLQIENPVIPSGTVSFSVRAELMSYPVDPATIPAWTVEIMFVCPNWPTSENSNGTSAGLQNYDLTVAGV